VHDSEGTGEVESPERRCFLNPTLTRCREDCVAHTGNQSKPCSLVNSIAGIADAQQKLSALPELWQRAVEQRWADALTGGRR